ncbi:short-chain dehydrogenase reductase family protein [Moniliophthora roreri MCA 2997]|uniref:Short-chain dehydrogenase reductase family protein n=1 Tax=Moniliophthora roreri (strain MCA 2997) TaxID=1381753 RepID=V2XLY4_MONRO|nr:short-chain dehydrogenase reductase family protein [Moniliophthora roreri MCA 2997]
MGRSWLLLLIPFLFATRKLVYETRRRRKILHQSERVLVLGGSSGIGREIARQYAARGAKVCIVGRTPEKLAEAVEECKGAISAVADLSNVEDMIRLRNMLETDLGGIDTIIVAAGVSATRPLLSIADVDSPTANATQAGVERAVTAASAAVQGNYIGPLVAAVTFIPLLKRTSSSPSILLISSLGAVVPAPTRTIYGSTKSASLLLYQSLAIEHPSINFSFILPSTVQGDFRASAVDVDSTAKATSTWNSEGLKVADVAKRCVEVVDSGEKLVFLPSTMRLGHLLYWIWPSFVEKKAMKKYGFTTTG